MIQNPDPFTLMTHGQILRSIGAAARARRRQLNLSRRELSEKSGVSTATISRFETGGVATVSVMTKLARALESLEDLEGLFHTSRYASLEEFVKNET